MISPHGVSTQLRAVTGGAGFHIAILKMRKNFAMGYVRTSMPSLLNWVQYRSK